MAAHVPYLAAPGSLRTALERIKAAQTPERVTADFVTTKFQNSKLQVKGGTGRALIPYLKKIGFVNPDGSPTEIYKRFRNSAQSKAAAAEAVKLGYKALASVNEHFYDLNDKDLQGVIVQVTGRAPDDSTTKYTLSTLKVLKHFADFDAAASTPEPEPKAQPAMPVNRGTGALACAASARDGAPEGRLEPLVHDQS